MRSSPLFLHDGAGQVPPEDIMTLGRLILFVAALTAAATAAAQSSSRARHGELYLYPLFVDGKSYSFEGGSSAKTDTGYGLGFGYNWNFNQHVSAGFEIEWAEQEYRATVQPGLGNLNLAGNISGTIEWRTIRFQGTYNLLQSNFTPYVSGGLGWTYIDTNIPAGLPESFCWYYPWYGSYCATYVPTETTTKFSYNAALGLRLDVGKGMFRVQAASQWIDWGGSYGSDDIINYRIDFGIKF
jgi:opacity protein-like surface antigen